MAKKNDVREFTLGTNRDKPRLWFNSKVWMPAAGFVRGAKFKATFEHNKVVLQLAKDGDHTVSGKLTSDGTWMPVIDINSKEIDFSTKALQVKVAQGRLTITPREQ